MYVTAICYHIFVFLPVSIFALYSSHLYFSANPYFIYTNATIVKMSNVV